MSEVGGRTYPNSVVPSEDAATEEKRFHKAYWWRNVNRILSIFGLLIIGAIVSLFSFPFERVIVRGCMES
jgi:hypothetical protein